MSLALAVLIFLVFAGSAISAVVWVNRHITFPRLVGGGAGKVTSVTIRIFVSCIAIIVVWAPLQLAAYAISALAP